MEAVAYAEGLGAETAFVSEDINCRDAFQLCALSARMTERIRLGTGVVNPYTRNPTSLAMAAATLDEVSNGRAVLGIGSSSPSLIQEQMGIRFGSSTRMLQEATEIIRALLDGHSVTYRGRHFQYTDASLDAAPIQPRVPIFFAAMGPQTLRLAGRLTDGVLLNVGASTDYIKWAVQQIRAGEAEARRPPGTVLIAAWLSTYISDDRAGAMARARTWLATVISVPRQGELLLQHTGVDTGILQQVRSLVRAYPHGGDPAAASHFIPPELAERLTLIGTREEVMQRIEEYRLAGVELPVLGISAIRTLYVA